MKSLKPLQTNLEDDHFKIVQKLAKEKGIPLASFVRMIILEHLKSLKKIKS